MSAHNYPHRNDPVMANTPSKVLLQIGLASVLLHMLVLLTMFFCTGYHWISYILLDYPWFGGVSTVLLLVEHTVWLHLLWEFAYGQTCSLVLAYFGVLTMTASWAMELIIPTEPDPYSVHPIFCVAFVVGCTLNLIGGLLLLPGKRHGVDPSYKYITVALGLVGVLCSAIWVAWYSLKHSLQLPPWRIEQTMQITAYITYLAGMAVTLDFWARQTQ
jgi:hypothetical protein